MLLLAAILVMAATAGQARADAGWFYSGDTQLRMDLQLLNDADVIIYPLNQWPIPRAAIRYALSNAKENFATNNAVMAALARVRARFEVPGSGQLTFNSDVRAGSPGLWRDFDTLARENGELSAGLDYDNSRVSVGLDVTAVTNPADADELRLDGSQATVQWGNWLISANAMDRWWGPAHESSLILSNNARPMATVMVERAEARAFETKWLSWLGPWRFSFGLSQMEDHRQDIDAPLFMAWRVSFMPFKKIEFGMSRTAQFCGKEQQCNLTVFGNMLAGNDNVGFNVSAANEPGNQMAGFDIRWNSPIGDLPYALYSQYIGEDQSSYMPSKFLAQLGLEMWKPLHGGILQGFFEYASTTCSANTSRGPYYNLAYNQGQFDVEGYRYKGRVVGYTSDRDAENWALGGIYSGEDGTVWTATARISQLNHDDFGDVRNTVASVPTDYKALEMGWKGRLLGEHVSVDAGVQSTQPKFGERSVELFGFVGWHHEFRP